MLDLYGGAKATGTIAKNFRFEWNGPTISFFNIFGKLLIFRSYKWIRHSHHNVTHLYKLAIAFRITSRIIMAMFASSKKLAKYMLENSDNLSVV